MRRIAIFILLYAFIHQMSAACGQSLPSVDSCLLSKQEDRLSAAKLYYDSAYQCLLNSDYISAMPKLIKISELVENLPEDMTDEEMHLIARAYYQMGYIFENMFINSYEAETMLRASKYQDIRHDSLWMLRTKVKLALSHQVMKNIDSVEYYLKEITPLSDSIKYFTEYYMTLYIEATNYYQKKDYDTSIYLHKEIINFKERHNENTIGDSLGLGITMFHSPYKYQSKPYLLKMFDIIATNPNANMRNMGAVASLLAELYKEEGNEDSLAICNKFLPDFIHDMAGEKADDMTVKYMYENFKTKRDQRLNELRLQKLLAEKKRTRNIVMSYAVALLIISAATVMMVMKKKNKKQWNYDGALSSFEQSDIVKRIKSNLTTENGEKISIKNMESYVDRQLSNLEFVELRNEADKYFEGRIARLSEQYPELMPTDIHCCCLSLIGFTNTEIAILFGVKYNAINSRISKIKKIFNTEENLRDFVIRHLRK